MRFLVSLAFAVVLIPLGYALGWVAAYYFGDNGDVSSAFLALLTLPLGVVTGLAASVIFAAKLSGPQ